MTQHLIYLRSWRRFFIFEQIQAHLSYTTKTMKANLSLFQFFTYTEDGCWSKIDRATKATQRVPNPWAIVWKLMRVQSKAWYVQIVDGMIVVVIVLCHRNNLRTTLKTASCQHATDRKREREGILCEGNE